jgi:enterochelin esterase family protein
VSARLQAFRTAAAEDPAAATEALRADLAAARGPLVEPIEGDELNLLVTFVWIGADGPVGLHTGARKSEIPMTNAMERIEGTDVWCLSVPVRRDVRTTYQFMVDDPLLRGNDNPLANLDNLMQVLEDARFQGFADPHNPNRLMPMSAVYVEGETLPPEHWESVLTLPGTEPLPWYAPAERSGGLTEHAFHSDVFGNDRKLVVYTPPGYDPGAEPYPLVLMSDGEFWHRIASVHVAVDNLIAAEEIPACIVVFMYNATSTSRYVELPCNDDLPRMLADELLPLVRGAYNVTVDRARSVIGGASYGGLVSSWTAFQRPDLFGNVMSSSGSYWWGWAGGNTAQYRFGRDGEPEWLTRQFVAAERKPIRFWIDIGLLEFGPNAMSPGVEHVGSNRHFRTVLQAKGYDVTYYESPGAHDLAIWQDTLVRGLKALLA